MSKPKAPTPPDPAATAAAQSAANRDTAGFNNTVNNPNQVTPYGSVSWSGGDPSYAGQRPTQTVTESGNQQALRLAQERAGINLGNLGADQAEKVGGILGTPYKSTRFNGADVTGGRLDLAGAMGGQYDNSKYDPTSALGDFGGSVENDTFNLASSGLDRQFGRSEEQLRSKLANQGIGQDSDAFRSEMEGFNTGKGQAYTDARLQARGAALAQRGQQAGELAQGSANYDTGRGQRLAEMLTERGTNLNEGETQNARDNAYNLSDRQTPLGEIGSIINGTPLNPINPGAYYSNTAQAGDIQDNTNAGYAQQVAAYNSQNQARGATLGGLAGLGGAALGTSGLRGVFSDARLKTDLEFIAEGADGLRWWTYRYLWDAPHVVRVGLIAQEAPARAVSLFEGYLMVDYSALGLPSGELLDLFARGNAGRISSSANEDIAPARRHALRAIELAGGPGLSGRGEARCCDASCQQSEQQRNSYDRGFPHSVLREHA